MIGNKDLSWVPKVVWCSFSDSLWYGVRNEKVEGRQRHSKQLWANICLPDSQDHFYPTLLQQVHNNSHALTLGHDFENILCIFLEHLLSQWIFKVNMSKIILICHSSSSLLLLLIWNTWILGKKFSSLSN